MLKSLFTSKTRVKIFKIFLLNPNQEYFIRELTRVLDEQINSVRRELDNLKKMGFLRSRVKNRKKYFFINPGFIFFNELRSIFLKNESNSNEIVKKVQKYGDFELIAMSGVFLNKASSIDLLLIGYLNDRTGLENYLEHELKTVTPIKFSILSREDFLYRLKCNDKFVSDIIADRENIIAVNKLEKYL